MTDVMITRDDRIEAAVTKALERIPLASLVRRRVVAVKPNDTWPCASVLGSSANLVVISDRLC